MIKIEVGQPWPGAIPPNEAAIADFFRDGHNTLLVAMPDMTEQEAEDYTRARAKAALVEAHGLVVLLWKFGEQPWIDTPFDIHRVPAEQRTVPILDKAEQRLAVEVYAIDLSTRLTRGVRYLTLSPALSAALVRAVNRQASSDPPTAASYSAFYENSTRKWLARAQFQTWCG
jgi:hypothetical protein